MNIKKIILLSLAAMSVMGAFTACSDNKVVGADEQSNTVAERSSSSVESGSSNSSISIKIIEDRIKAISKPNLAAAVIVSNEKVIEDTINAHETFEKVIQSIIDDDSYKVTIADSAEWTKFEGADGSIGYWNWRTEEVNAMVDENGVVHGPLWHRVEVYPSEGSVSKVIQCTSSNSCTSNSSSLNSFSPFLRRLALIAACMPLRSAISDPIIPPGRPQPTSRDVISAFFGSIQ